MENAPEAFDTARYGERVTTMTALIAGWMLQNTCTTPGRRKVTVRELPGAYNPRSNTWPLKFEKTL
jgi:hypothetical protein